MEEEIECWPNFRMFWTQALVYVTRMKKTQRLGGNQLLRLTANENIEKMAKFIVETTFEV